MKNLLLTTTILAGCAFAAPARAQVPVTDVASLAQQIKEYLQVYQSYLTQLQQLEQEIQSVEWAAQQYASFVQNPSLGAALGLMNNAGLGSVLPVNPYAVQGLINGQGGLNATLGALSTLTNNAYNSNLIYKCETASWACQQQQQNATGLAGAQGIAMNSVQMLSQHAMVLTALREQLASATTPAQRENIMAAIQTEEAWAAEQGQQLAATQIMINSQQQIRQQQSDERLSKDAAEFIASAPPLVR